MYLSHPDEYTQRITIYIKPMTTATATTTALKTKTYRFEFSKDFIYELSRFSKVHQYDERHTYKKEWAIWKSDQAIAEIMEMEKRRLEENGYVGDIEDKMFKSGRYYFRKKTAMTTMTTTDKTPRGAAESAEVPESKSAEVAEKKDTRPTPTTPRTPATPATPATFESSKQPRKPYITMSKQCIRMMDTHIATHSTTNNFKPSSCYDNFYNEKMASADMAAEIEKIIEKYENIRRNAPTPAGKTVEEITIEIMDKIKKTYKNRYYRFVNNKQQPQQNAAHDDDDNNE
jgi:hypothetical protein